MYPSSLSSLSFHYIFIILFINIFIRLSRAAEGFYIFQIIIFICMKQILIYSVRCYLFNSNIYSYLGVVEILNLITTIFIRVGSQGKIRPIEFSTEKILILGELVKR